MGSDVFHDFQIPFGVSIGCNIRVGHLIGAEKPMQAKRAVKVGLSMVCKYQITFLLGLRLQKSSNRF